MAILHDFPFFPLEFTKEGQVFRPAEVDALQVFLRQRPATDLLVLAHGWNNNLREARDLYDQLLGGVRQELDAHRLPALATRQFAVLGVFWPSKKFADKELTAGGAAGVGTRITDALLLAELNRLRDVFDAPNANKLLAQARALVPQLDDRQTARMAFADLLRALVPGPETSPDVDAARAFRTQPGHELLHHLSQPLPLTLLPPAGSPSPTGHVAGLGQFWGSLKAGAWNLLNFTTYYQMKERAGKVGIGLHQVLAQAQQAAPPVKLHLLGHSFGGRLVTAAAGAPGHPAFRVNTLTLLQAAFSHHGFSDAYDGTTPGFFRQLITNQTVTGPILISHSVHDTAVGKMYPLASLLARQVASGLGDARDPYGGMGRNGAQKTPEASQGFLLAVGESYAFQPGRIYNLNADAVVQSHSDISHPEVVAATLQAIAST